MLFSNFQPKLTWLESQTNFEATFEPASLQLSLLSKPFKILARVYKYA